VTFLVFESINTILAINFQKISAVTKALKMNRLHVFGINPLIIERPKAKLIIF